MLTINHFLVLSIILFTLSIAGMVINRKNIILLLMCIELMLMAVNTNFVAFAYFLNQPVGELFVFFVLTVAAAEIAIGLAILVLFYRHKGSIDVVDMSELKG